MPPASLFLKWPISITISITLSGDIIYTLSGDIIYTLSGDIHIFFVSDCEDTDTCSSDSRYDSTSDGRNRLPPISPMVCFNQITNLKVSMKDL